MTAPLDAGRLRRRMVLQVPVDTPDLAGGVTRTWADIAALWAALEPVSIAPAVTGEAPGTLARFSVTLRWRDGVSAGQRLTLGARRFEVRSAIDPDGRRRRLLLAVEEIAA